jgi:hypothetical protein
MGSGDAYVYCLIISDDVAGKVNTLNQIRDGIDREVKAILKKIDEERKQNPDARNPELGDRGLKLLEDDRDLRSRIIALCKKPIAIYHVASDDWLEAYKACSEAEFNPMYVADFLDHVNGKLWNGEDLEKHHYDATCICFPSHYDTDEEFLEELGVNTRRLDDYNNRKMTQPIRKDIYALVNLSTGEVSRYGSLVSIAYEWARNKYALANQDGEFEVRELYVTENKVFSEDELNDVIEKAHNNLT